MGKAKPVNIERIAAGHRALSICDAVCREHHPDLAAATIALFWRLGWAADKDQHLVLGKCVKVSEQTKEMLGEENDIDFAILLNHEVCSVRNNDGSWQFTDAQLAALIDHELCHAAPLMDDKTGLQKRDERGRLLWRIRKHDIEEFRAIVERHGCYKRDLESFAQALLRAKDLPLLDPADAAPAPTKRTKLSA